MSYLSPFVRSIVLGTFAIALVVCSFVNAAEGKFDATWRLSTIPIPRLEAVPVIDATIHDAEWARATLFPPTVEMDPGRKAGMPLRKRTFIWMGYTADSIYMAWRQTLPSEHLPLPISITDVRDACEGPDNAVNVWLAPDPAKEYQYHIAGNAASQIFDRRADDPMERRWNGNITYKSRLTDTGWEGEMQIPFKELGVNEIPADGTKWRCNLYSFWRKYEPTLSSWPFVRWREKGEVGTIVFAGSAPAIRFEEDGVVKFVGGEAPIQTKLFHRKEKARQSYNQQIASAFLLSQAEGGTWEGYDKIIGDGLKPFEDASQPEKPGEYLLRYEWKKGDQVLAAGVQPFYKAPPLDVDVTPYFLQANKLLIEASTQIPQAAVLETNLKPDGSTLRGVFKSQRVEVNYPVGDLKEGKYEVAAAAKDDKNNVVASTTVPLVKPEPPVWWTLKEGLEPRVPPPWHPVKAAKNKADVLGRTYTFDKIAVPSQVKVTPLAGEARDILAGPIEFVAAKPWEKSKVELVKKDAEAAVYRSESVAGNLKMTVTTQVEFDGFMYVDVDLAGEGSIDKLDLVIPFKKEHATLMQNYFKTSGPGDVHWKNLSETNNPYKAGRRFVGFVPDYTLYTPPMLTTWIGTDHYGLEWSCESSEGWSMASPNKAMEVKRDGDRVLLTCHLINKAVKLSKEKPRRIRFGLIATPSKKMMPYLAKVRFYDDYFPALTPYTWGEYPVWHPPLKNPQLIEKWSKWIENSGKVGCKVLINGGWNISTQTPEWDTWGKEMVAEPLQNVSFSDAKQFAACYRSPYASFMVNSFGYNARLLKFDGIRFDTVVPGYECNSAAHGCGWQDDEGKLWPKTPIFEQREIWKKLYRIFHGGVRKDGCIQTPNAAGPIMAVHSFSDHHEIGEGYYEKAKTLKDGYTPDMIRANMTGLAYGFRAENNLKGGPLMVNQRLAALWVNGVEGRHGDFRFWRAGYEAHSNPANMIWEAWAWVDRWNSHFLGYWENSDYVSLKLADGSPVGYPDKKWVMASIWWQKKGPRVLLVVTNYEQQPTEAHVRLDLKKLGFKGKLFAEDGVTGEPLAIGEDGTLKLGVLQERYRLVKISNDRPKFHEDALGDNLLSGASTEASSTWTSPDIKLDPNAAYVLKAKVKIDKAIGAETANPNIAGQWGPQIAHFVSINLVGEGINGIHATNKIALCGIKGTDQFLPYRETDNYKRAYQPQMWETTPDWWTLFVPVGTASNTATGKFVVSLTDAGQCQIKELELRKVK